MRDLMILCTGDLHLGRVSSKCGPERDEAFSVRAAWGRLVDLAITRGVHLVLISGDIADDGGNRYEAMGPFEQEISRLSAHGIAVYLVTGNHDARTLPDILRLCDHADVHLLGANGTWEAVGWPADDPAVTLLGWSHPARPVARLPLDNLPPLPTGAPVIAIAHADYRGTDDYAAVRVNDLRRVPVDLWLLGHIHAPEWIDGPPPILNPGSLQALDPGEPGIHGPWLVEIAGGAVASVVQLPLSSVTYAAVTVDITDLGDNELLAHLLPSLQAASAGRRLSARVTLTGRTGQLPQLHAARAQILQEQPLLEGHDIFFDTLDLSALRPAYDLQKIASEGGAIGDVARLLLALEAGETPPALRDAEDAARAMLANATLAAATEHDPLPTPAVLLRTEATRLLDALLAQVETPR
jgi:DNA repair exonuclease SbcCD nuclease subunit